MSFGDFKMDISSSETNLVIVTNKRRLVTFCKLYRNIILFLTAPLVLLPIIFIGESNAYPCFYIFCVAAVYWSTNVAHPAVISLAPLALSTIFSLFNVEIITSIHVTTALLDCLGVMLINAAIEHCNIHRRVALKIMLIFGCSHYRISFLLFFTTMVLSMWVSNIIICGLMIPLVKSILDELEKLGIIEVYESFDKERNTTRARNPTVFTSFYFLGIAYSSSIGSMATLFGSRSNQIFKMIFETTFPMGPKIEFPHVMLLNLPGVLLMETLVYLWLNFYFLGLFRSYHGAPLQMSMTEEETEYMNTLLAAKYRQLGELQFQEMFVSALVLLMMVLQMINDMTFIDSSNHQTIIGQMKLSVPSIVCAMVLFITPVNLDLRFFRRHSGAPRSLPPAPLKMCLSWELVKERVPWSVLLVIGSSSTMFEALKMSKMTQEFEKFLMLFSDWPAPALVLIVIILCKTLTEFACNITVAGILLPHIAKVCVMSKVNPHYLMIAGTLTISLPFHLMTGTPVYAMVLAYVNISPKTMLRVGFIPSAISVAIIWFTVITWSRAIWPEINLYPKWADLHTLD